MPRQVKRKRRRPPVPATQKGEPKRGNPPPAPYDGPTTFTEALLRHVWHRKWPLVPVFACVLWFVFWATLPESWRDRLLSVVFSPSRLAGPAHCAKPTKPVLISPGENQVLPNHYYGKGEPWKFDWADSKCDSGAIAGYRIIVRAVGTNVPAVDRVVAQSDFTGDLGGTISGRYWTWKVCAIDDRGEFSDWSEERPFQVPEWKEPG
jgi:hypothetical protein